MNRKTVLCVAGAAALLCVAANTIHWTLASPDAAGARAPFLSIPLPASENTLVPKAYLHTRLSVLPNILYVGERRDFCVELSNLAETPIDFEATCYLGDKAKHQFRLSLPAHGIAVQAVPVCVLESESNQTVRLDFTHGAEQLARCEFVLRDTQTDLSGIETDGVRFQTRSKTRVVLVHRHPDEATYRRFQLLDEVTRSRERAGADVVLAVPDFDGLDGRTVPNLPTMIVNRLGARRVVRCERLANPLEAALQSAQRLPPKGPVLFCIACGRDEAFRRLPLCDFERALDVLLARAERWNPSIQWVLATPLPIVGEVDVTETYTNAIRNVGRQHHARLVDIHALTLKTPNWQSWFAHGVGADILDLEPNSAGREQVAAWIAGALK